MALITKGTKKEQTTVKKTTEDLFDQHTQGGEAATTATEKVVPIEAIEKPADTKVKKKGTATTRVTKKAGNVETSVTETSETVDNGGSAGAEVIEEKPKEEVKKETKARTPRTRPKKEDDTVVEESSEVTTALSLPKHVDPNAIGTVGVTGSRTINLGNFESAKIEVHLALPTALADADATYEYASKWVEAKLESAIPTPTVTRTVPQTQRTVVHGDDKPVVTQRTTSTANAAPKQAQATAAATKPKEDRPREQQRGDVGGRLPAGYEVGSIHDPNAHYHEDL